MSSQNPTAKYVKPAVECFHGGQSFRTCPNFKCDFSVTTNISGPPRNAIEAAKATFADMEHYPEQDAWVPRCYFADFIGITPNECLMGNGSSELIDVTCRIFKPGTTWRPGPWPAQYLEYNRAAKSAGLVKVPAGTQSADLTIFVNPNSPTGNFLELDEIRKMLDADPKSTFIIDESFLICYGPDWKEHSAMQLIKEYGDRVIVISSWTKVFACPLIRIGTVVSTKAIIDRIAALQAPWSVNGFAQAFFVQALQEKNYFDECWEVTSKINSEMRTKLLEMGFKPNMDAPTWVPYVYCDFLTTEIALLAEKIAFDAGLPIRHCGSFGQPQYVRFGVRQMHYFDELLSVLKSDAHFMELVNAAKSV